MNKLVLSDHKALSHEFKEDSTFKLERIKEIIEPYAIAQIKIDDISNKLKDAFLNDITEIKIKRIINENKHEFKQKTKKFKFKTNKIKKNSWKNKRVSKIKDYEAIEKIINKHINENWNIFLKELQSLRIKKM